MAFESHDYPSQHCTSLSSTLPQFLEKRSGRDMCHDSELIRGALLSNSFTQAHGNCFRLDVNGFPVSTSAFRLPQIAELTAR